MKHRSQNKIMIVLLALLMFVGALPLQALAETVVALPNVVDVVPETTMSEETVEQTQVVDENLVITLDGEEVTEIELLDYEKIEITADGLSADADYQWQILHPENEGQWVNIFESTEQSLSVTKALINNVLRADGTTMVRCTAAYGEKAFESSPVIVSLIETVSEEVHLPTMDNGNDGIMTVDDTTTETPEFVTITVKYMRYDYLKVNDQYVLDTVGVEAFTPYVATILYNDSLKATVQFPTIVGYRSYLDGQADTDTDTSMTIDLTNVTKNQEYVVKFVPTDVKYVVLYYFQNIYDDNYVEDPTVTVVSTGQTGNMPDTKHVQREFDGFTSMYYQPDTIAADGSTVFEVYYERNYYLMDFDCGGGYGADPVYVRYGTYVSVPDPVRSGWVFQGWDLTSAKDEAGNTLSLKEADGVTLIDYSDSVADTLPATMPYYNTAYRAIWGRSPTTFTVVFWVQNANDDAYSYAYSLENIVATTGDVINLDTIVKYKEPVTDTYIYTHLNPSYSLAPYVTLDEESTPEIVLEGDGSSVFNVYYKRNEYKLRFYYARVHVNTGEISIPVDYSGYNNSSSADLGAADWEVIDELPVLDSSFPSTTITLGSGNNAYTYHYYEFTARYGQNISNLWPNSSGKYSSYSLSGWTAQYGSRFDTDNTIPVVYGPYNNLDFQLMVNTSNTANTGAIGHTFLAHWVTDPVLMEFWTYANIIGGETEYNSRVPNDTVIDEYKDVFDASNYNRYWKYWGTKVLRYFERVLITPLSANSGASSNVYNNSRYSVEGMTYHARDNYEGTSPSTYENSNGEIVTVYVFHYARNTYSLEFNNYGTSLISHNAANTLDYTGNGVFYGADLESYVTEATSLLKYPSTLEPDAYYFDGWYTGPNGSGRKVVFKTDDDTTQYDSSVYLVDPTMPADNLILFAYWAPKTWEVSFYYDYNDYLAKDPWEHENADGETVTYPINVTHGNLLGTAHYANPTRTGYNFVGWFYIDGNGKKRFAPESMEIKKELKLFAEWISAEGVSTQYTVTYVEVDSNSNVVQEIGAKTEGYSTVGKTKTFNAKGSFALNEGFRQGYFPKTASHSILMAPMDEDGTTPNTYQFKYVKDPLVYYEIRYVDIAMNKTIHDPVVKSTQDAVVTERFLPINGYVPMPGYYYQTKSLATDGDNEITDPVIKSNIITFYYMADTEHGAYSIEYYLEDESGSVSYDGKTYTQKTSITNTADLKVNGEANVINSGEEFEILPFDGYHFSKATVSNFTVNDSIVKETVSATYAADANHTANISGTLDANGLTIRLYYNKRSFDYTIKYVEYGNATNVIQSETGTALFGTDITRTAPLSITTSSGDYYDYYLKDTPDFDEEDENLRKQTITIRTPVTDDPSTDINEAYNNEMVFYYKQRQVTVYYRAVTKISGAKGYGVVSLQSEMAATADTLTGSNARAGSGYRFVGWFTDPSCAETSKVNTNWLYIPDKDGKASEQNANGTMLKPGTLSAENLTVEYYALFEPIETELTISKTGMNSDDHHSVFRVQGLGKLNFIDLTVSIEKNGSVTIKNLPVGEYEVTELTEWTWKYSDNPGWSFTDTDNASNGTGKVASITLSSSKGTVQFTNTYLDTDWLSSETNAYYLE